MKNDLKSIKLIGELAAFVFKAGGDEFDVSFKEKNEGIEITIKSKLKDITPDQLETLKGLYTPRQSEVEDYYWELAGESDNYQELTLVGMMIDRAEYSYENGLLKITVYRHK
ncbi:hypothetical protein DFR79_1281 [Halanaerobium saccharolyticum]|uniref:Uncharacterized protein n=1 Tax=Halanaerobium saccharolyticum TaxID=43595 RepID=A0A4R6LIL8_9FIRM|nr:hypothetical protein [Halanaerobium saccharolyticum]TDO78333.1 hypothetical protein DFR79_1281 [Halanaerobium saccharolyticum]